ncbi:MAG: DUF3310 domain-containing protein [Candidatus Nanoperiomorbaceae bacterium]
MDDPVNNPSHYTCFGSAEVIDITERLDFCRGSAVKYLCRAGRKDGAAWYVQREILRIQPAAFWRHHRHSTIESEPA